MNDELQQQLIKDLLIESFEGLDLFDKELLALERGQGGPDSFNGMFRIVHTIKGTSGCIGLGKLESVGHVGENLLSLLRDGKLALSPEMIAALLEYSDAMKEILQTLETTGGLGEKDYSLLLEKLEAMQKVSPAIVVTAPPRANFGLFEEEDAPAEPAAAEAVNHEAAPEDSPAPERTVADKENAPKTGQSASETAIRVEVAQLDKLMNLVGELVLARNQIVQHSGEAKGGNGLLAAAQRLNLITTELQENVMKTRMLPIGNAWAKFPRIVRDVAHEIGKRVQLVMEGSETELDRTIIEAIKDPLTHIVRNAIDHGIEMPEAREALGKPAEGMLLLRAFHEGGQVNIEIMDDGRGINLPRVKEKALQSGLVTKEQVARMSDRDIINLLFLPGFSTAEKVTNLSGRGVGMDVVKTNIEKIGGSVDLQSEQNQGTTLRIKIPLTLAIIPALIVTTAEERFAIPQVNLLELVRIDGSELDTAIESVFGAPVYRLRGKLLPLVYLNEALKISRKEASGPDGQKSANIVVVQADTQQFGLVVDQVNDTQEIVVKPLGRHLKGLPVYAGATILGDGEVALILDVMGLAQHSGVLAKSGEKSLNEAHKADQNSAGDRQMLLIFSLGAESRLALPLTSVGRLEKFSKSQIERQGSQEVVQYRGHIMPLLRLASVLDVHGAAHDAEDLPVVVYSGKGRSIGLVVGDILDILEHSVELQNRNLRFGISGSSVVQGKVTEFVDVSALIQQFQHEPSNN